MKWWTLQQFRSRNARTRLAAVAKLSRAEAAGLIDPLSELLADSDPEVRIAVSAALAQTNEALAAVRMGARLYKEPDAKVKVALVQGMASMPGDKANQFLVDALSDPAGEVGWHAAKGLQSLRWQPASDTERAAWLLASNQFDDAVNCGPAAAEPLARLTKSVAFQRCIRAIEGLAKLGGSQAVKPILKCLSSDDFTVRSAAANALGELGDGRAFEPLVRALLDSQYQVALAACGSLGKMGDQRAVEPLTRVLQHSSPDVRTAAVVALGRLRDKQAAMPVIQLLKDNDPDVREAAVTALGLMGNEEAIEHLVVALIDPENSIREAASYALRRLEPYWERSEAASRGIPKLQAALKSGEYRVRHSAADALKKLGVSNDKENSLVTDGDGALRKRQAAHTILLSLLSEKDPHFRQAAAEALGRIGLASSIAPLVQRLSDTDPGVQSAAARSLEALRWHPSQNQEKARQLVALERWEDAVGMGPDAVDALTGALAWNDAKARRRVIESLVHIGGAKAVSALRALAADPVLAIREEALRALSILESNHPSPPVTNDMWGETPTIS